MMIGSKCVFNGALLHYDKRDAIRQRPFLVGAAGVKFAAVAEELTAGRNDLHIGLTTQQFQQARKPDAIYRLTQCVACLDEDKLCGQEWSGRAPT